MTELRVRCPKCNKLRKGFEIVGRPIFYTVEAIGVTLKCRECGNEFFANYDFVECRNKPEKVIP